MTFERASEWRRRLSATPMPLPMAVPWPSMMPSAQLGQHAQEGAVVERERHVRVGLAPEHDEADAIGRAAAHEVLDDHLGGVEAVGHQVGLLHRARDVERDDDVDALELEVVVDARGLRARQRHAHQHDRGQAQHQRQLCQARHEAARLRAELTGARVGQRGAAARPAREPGPQHERDGDGHERERARVREAKPLDVAQEHEVGGRERTEDGGDERVGDRRARRRGRRFARGPRVSHGRSPRRPRRPRARRRGPTGRRRGLSARAGRRHDPDRRLQRAARLGRGGRDLGELHQVAGRQPALDLAQHQLAPRGAAQLVDQLVGGQLQRIEAEARAQVLADHLRDREIEGPVVGVLEEAVGAQAIELLERDLVRRPRRRPRRARRARAGGARRARSRARPAPPPAALRRCRPAIGSAARRPPAARP